MIQARWALHSLCLVVLCVAAPSNAFDIMCLANSDAKTEAEIKIYCSVSNPKDSSQGAGAQCRAVHGQHCSPISWEWLASGSHDSPLYSCGAIAVLVDQDGVHIRGTAAKTKEEAERLALTSCDKVLANGTIIHHTKCSKVVKSLCVPPSAPSEQR